ncbi:hypothetical protein ACF1FY_35465, partial [Streptomyces althioticus]
MTTPPATGDPLPPPRPSEPPVTAPAKASPEGDVTGPDTAAPTPPSTLRQILTPVAPARPTEPLGTTTALAQTPATPADLTGKNLTGGKDGNGAAGADGTREGALSALVRALAERWRRTGTTTSIKRQHDVK